MKKIISLTALVLALSVGYANAEIKEISISGGTLDRSFDTERTLYYVDTASAEIPEISAEGAEVIKRASDLSSDNIRDRVTVLKDTQTGKEYRFVMRVKDVEAKITAFSISKDGELNIEYSAPESEYVNLLILKPVLEGAEESFKISDLDGSDDAEKVLTISGLKGGDGSFSYKLSEENVIGMYTAVLGGDKISASKKAEKTTYYISESGLEKVIDELNAVSGENETEKLQNLDRFIEKYAIVLNIDQDEYTRISDRSLFVEYLTNQNFKNIDDVMENYEIAMILSEINAADKGTVLDLIEENQEILEVDLEIYNELDNAATVAELIKARKYTTADELKASFNKAVAVRYINESEPSEIEERFGKVIDILVEDENIKSDYEKSTNKAKILKSLVNQNFTDADDFAEGLKDAIEENASDKGSDSVSSGNKGGKGSSGGSSYMPYIPAVKTEEQAAEPDEEKTVQTKDTLYDDIADVEWAREAIMLLSDRKIVNGKGNKKFAPNDYVTREEFVKMLVIALELKSNNSSVTFEDVSENDWYYEYILTGVGNKVVTGKSEKIFGVNENITREDMAVMTMRAVNAAKLSIDNVINSIYYELEFTDTEEISEYAKESVTLLVKKGIVSGVGDNRYAPKSNATRAQAAQMIYKVIKDN